MNPEFKKKSIRKTFVSIVIFFGIAALLGFGAADVVICQTNPDANQMSSNDKTAGTVRELLQQELDLGTRPEGLIAKCARSGGRSGGGGRGYGGRGGGFGHGPSLQSMINQAWKNSMAEEAIQEQKWKELEKIRDSDWSKTEVPSSTRTTSKPTSKPPTQSKTKISNIQPSDTGSQDRGKSDPGSLLSGSAGMQNIAATPGEPKRPLAEAMPYASEPAKETTAEELAKEFKELKNDIEQKEAIVEEVDKQATEFKNKAIWSHPDAGKALNDLSAIDGTGSPEQETPEFKIPYWNEKADQAKEILKEENKKLNDLKQQQRDVLKKYYELRKKEQGSGVPGGGK